MAEQKDVEAGGAVAAGFLKKMQLPKLPRVLNVEEKKYLLTVERGDMARVKAILQKAHHEKHIDVNCVDSVGRGALTLAIEGENMEMVELLVIMGLETKDALLQAVNSEFIEAVELLLEHEELIYKPGQPYSWQKVDPNTAQFTADMTPLMLAAQRDNYEILKILLDRGATLPDPHDARCGCDTCIRETAEDSLRHSLKRLNQYRALASPSLIALSSADPLLTAFELSWELRNLAFEEQESKAEYLELRQQVQNFAVDLLDQSRSSTELAIILNYDPESEEGFSEGDTMKLARLELAINFKQKKFVAHPNIQQLLSSIWYEGVPGFRRKTTLEKINALIRVAILFPCYCTLYMVAPNCETGKKMRKPFMKFLIHASSYLFFLLILILVSLRAEVEVILLLGPDWMVEWMKEKLRKQRGNGPTHLEMAVSVYVLGFIWEETQEILTQGIQDYLRNMWNFIDFTRNSLYVGVAILRFGAFIQQYQEISNDPQTMYIPKEDWAAFDPHLIAEGLFAAANIFSALKLVHLFSINPHLGPLQISLGRMVIDIVKFFFIYSLVLWAFACGLNQLLWYYADLEKSKCYILPGGLPDWEHNGDSCMKWRSFGNVFEASQSLFWASFGMVGLENFELAGIKTYTRFWGLLMFGSYSVINVIVLLNLLIAMMSNSYTRIDEHSDTEWKFARTKLWLSYFEESATLPPPFNIMPTPKVIMNLLGLRKKKAEEKPEEVIKEEKKELESRYIAVMRALVWRYVASMHRQADEDLVTEDDINELKGDVSALRYELLEVFERNGMDVSFTNKKEKTVLAKRNKVWERRLMKDVQVIPKNENETGKEKFKRLAQMTIDKAKPSNWDHTLAGTGLVSQIGRCRNKQELKNQNMLLHAMEEAKKLVLQAPVPHAVSRAGSPIKVAGVGCHNMLKLIIDEPNPPKKKAPIPPAAANTLTGLLRTATLKSRSVPEISVEAPGTSGYEMLEPELDESPSDVSSLTDAEPLVSINVQGEYSPLKVIKRKAAVSPVPGEEPGPEDGVKTPPEDISVARPVAPEIVPAEGAIPPPPTQVKVKAPQAPSMEVTPSSPPKEARPLKASSSPPKVAPPPPKPDSPSPSTSTEPCEPTRSSSTEKLIKPAEKAKPDKSPRKHQVKDGWL